MRVTPVKKLAAGRRGSFARCWRLPLSGQTLQQAEALWKARQYQEANKVFRDLVAKNPDNPDYRVRWGRMYLEHAQAADIQTAGDLFNEALAIKKDCAGALLGLALIAAENYGGNAATLAQKALEADPKLLEAQELLARLALEDNNNAKAAEEAHKALDLDKNSDCRARPFWPPWTGWRTRRKALGSARRQGLSRRPPTSSCSTAATRRPSSFTARRSRSIRISYSARSQLGINLMRLGQNEEAYKQLKHCWDNGFQDSATKNTLTLMDSYKNFVTFTNCPHHAEDG